MSPACMNSYVVGYSSVKLSEKDDSFNPKVRDAWVGIDLDDEPESLLDSLNVWRENVVSGSFRGILRLSRHVELKLSDHLTS